MSNISTFYCCSYYLDQYNQTEHNIINKQLKYNYELLGVKLHLLLVTEYPRRRRYDCLTKALYSAIHKIRTVKDKIVDIHPQ